MDWPLLDGQTVETAGVVAASSVGVTVTGGSANTKGSWAELISASTYDTSALLVNIHKGSAASDVLVDIGIGGSGSEVVLLPNLRGDIATGLLHRGGPSLWPVAIPRGTRVAARCQSTTASATIRAQAVLLGGGFLTPPGMSRVTDYGTNTADSGGVSVDPGGSTNTKGSWSQITASTTNPMRAMLIGVGNQNNTGRAATDWLLDIGIGAGGSETVIVADVHVESSTQGDEMVPVWIGPIPVNIPAGTRLAARSAASVVADATDRLFDITIYGID